MCLNSTTFKEIRVKWTPVNQDIIDGSKINVIWELSHNLNRFKLHKIGPLPIWARWRPQILLAIVFHSLVSTNSVGYEILVIGSILLQLISHKNSSFESQVCEIDGYFTIDSLIPAKTSFSFLRHNLSLCGSVPQLPRHCNFGVWRMTLARKYLVMGIISSCIWWTQF